MRRQVTPVWLLCTLAASSLSAPAPQVPDARLELRLRAVPPKVRRGQPVRWEVTVVNRGRKAATLVQPGDGSDCGWRTPIVEWLIDGKVGGEIEFRSGEVEVKKGAKPAPKPALKPACLTGRGRRIARCGNINPLKAQEVFDLPPGKEVTFNSWVGSPTLPAGAHKVAVRYFHLPALEWRGSPLGKHDEKAMGRIKGSLPVALESNAVEIVVQP
jgi:hypothetical protein